MFGYSTLTFLYDIYVCFKKCTVLLGYSTLTFLYDGIKTDPFTKYKKGFWWVKFFLLSFKFSGVFVNNY